MKSEYNVKFIDHIELSADEIKEIFKDVFMPGERVVIKLHFGEPGNKTAFTPEIVRPFVQVLNEMGFETVLFDCPVLYPSPRDNKGTYEKYIFDKGFDEISPCEICDDYEPVKLHDGEVAELAKIMTNAKNLLVLTHVKGHQMAGFGGSIKNIGIGATSPKTKALVHEVEKNNGGYGFSEDRLGEVVAAAIKKMPKNKLFINIIRDVTKGCDCLGHSTKIIAPDLGVVVSDNLVLVDQASLDIVNKSVTDAFTKATKINPQTHIDSTAKYSGLLKEYTLT